MRVTSQHISRPRYLVGRVLHFMFVVQTPPPLVLFENAVPWQVSQQHLHQRNASIHQPNANLFIDKKEQKHRLYNYGLVELDPTLANGQYLNVCGIFVYASISFLWQREMHLSPPFTHKLLRLDRLNKTTLSAPVSSRPRRLGGFSGFLVLLRHQRHAAHHIQVSRFMASP